MNNQRNGFTLVEMLLVMVIVSSIVIMSARYFTQRTDDLRIEKTVAQMQQILNAGLSYYVANGRWPTTMACLRADSGSGCTVQYLPSTLINNPYELPYHVAAGTSFVNFYVYAGIAGYLAASKAQTIVGKLPMGFTGNSLTEMSDKVVANEPCLAAATSCQAVASVNIPAQNLNNASAVNFAGMYHHGGCVPVPSCPDGTNMTPTIMVVPASVSGMNDANSVNVYPISSFTAYTSEASPSASPAACQNGGATQAPTPCGTINGSASVSGTYWRVCLQVITEKGNVAVTNTGGTSSASSPYYPWGGNVSLMAITRCAINSEPAGSAFTVFTQ